MNHPARFPSYSSARSDGSRTPREARPWVVPLAELIALPVGVTGPVLVAPFVFEAAVWAGNRGEVVGVSMLTRIPR